MKIYSITKGQLITLWIFGLIATLAAMIEIDSYDPSGWAIIFAIGIPASLIFVTLGWSAKRKNVGGGSAPGIQQFCKSCGAKIFESGQYCQSCGAKYA